MLESQKSIASTEAIAALIPNEFENLTVAQPSVPKTGENTFTVESQVSKVTATSSNLTPILWVPDIVEAHHLFKMFQLVEHTQVIEEVLPGQHYILVEQHTPEHVIKSIAWKVKAAGCHCYVHRLNQPLENLLDGIVTAKELTIMILDCAPYDVWSHNNDYSRLSLKEAYKVAEAALTLLPKPEKLVELGTLRERCGSNSWDWNKLMGELEKEFKLEAERRSGVNKFTEEIKTTKSKHEQNFNTIHEAWGKRLKWNALKKQVELDGIWLPLDRIKTRIARDLHIDIAREDAKELILELAHENSYNPVVEYLKAVELAHPNVDVTVLNTLAHNYLGTSDPLHAALMKRTLLASVVARAFQPGCKHDNICILQGEQNTLKSTFWEVLAGKNWFTDDITSGSEKDEILKLSQYWIMEYAEFETVYGKKEVSALKAFLSRKTDSIRRPYGTDIEDVPRPSIFVGTTNKSEFLHDPTGERRYWIIPVLVNKINISLLRTERDLIWAAAVKLYRQDEQWWLTDDEEELLKKANGQYQMADSWESVIETYLTNRSSVVIGDILADVLKIEVSKRDRTSEMRVSQILRRLGWQKSDKQRRINGKPRWVWELMALSQPFENILGCDKVMTKVVTPSNIDETSISGSVSQPSQPFEENFAKDISHNQQNNVLSSQQNIEKDVTGCDTPPSQIPVTHEQQALEPVITSVTTFSTNDLEVSDSYSVVTVTTSDSHTPTSKNDFCQSQ